MDALRAGNMRSRRLLQLNEEPARAAPSDQAALTGALTSAVTMGPSSADEMRFLFGRCSVVAPMFTRCAGRIVEMAVQVDTGDQGVFGARVRIGSTRHIFR